MGKVFDWTLKSFLNMFGNWVQIATAAEMEESDIYVGYRCAAIDVGATDC